jgi:hypothetical protein
VEKNDILSAIHAAELEDDAEHDQDLLTIQQQLFKLFGFREQDYKVTEHLDALETQDGYVESWEDSDGDRYWQFSNLFDKLPEETKCLLTGVNEWY